MLGSSRWKWPALVVAIAAVLADNCATAQVVSALHVVNGSQITWDRAPSPEDLKSLYDLGAHGQLVNAISQLRCELQVDGSLANCAIMREAPGGFAFGLASVRASTLYRARMTDDLKSLIAAGGVSVILPFTWSPRS